MGSHSKEKQHETQAYIHTRFLCMYNCMISKIIKMLRQCQLSCIHIHIYNISNYSCHTLRSSSICLDGVGNLFHFSSHLLSFKCRCKRLIESQQAFEGRSCGLLTNIYMYICMYVVHRRVPCKLFVRTFVHKLLSSFSIMILLLLLRFSIIYF